MCTAYLGFVWGWRGGACGFKPVTGQGGALRTETFIMSPCPGLGPDNLNCGLYLLARPETKPYLT